MKLNKCIIGLFAAITLLTFAGGKAQAEVEETKLTKDIIKAEITKDASMKVVESLTFELQENDNEVFKDIYFDKADGISNISVSEIREKQKAYRRVKSVSDGDTGVYTLDEDTDSVRIRIYFDPDSESKSFRISYKILGAAKKYNDTGELYWSFFNSENQMPIEKLRINLVLPEGASMEETKLFGHDSFDDDWIMMDDRTINFSADNVISGDNIEVRTIFPKELIPEAKKSFYESEMISGLENAFETIMDEENEYINRKLQRAQDRKDLSKDIRYIIAFTSIISVLFIVYIIISRKKYSYIEDLTATEDIRSYNPAVLSFNTKRVLEENDVMASVFELVRRGYLAVEGNDDKCRIFRTKEIDEGILKHEAYLIKWLIDKIGNGEFVTIEEIKSYGEKKTKEFRGQFELWKKEVKQEANKLKLFDKKVENIKYIMIMVEIVFISATLLLTITLNMYLYISIGLSLAFFAAVFFINTRTLEGNVQYTMWHRMKRRIKNLSLAKVEQWADDPSKGEVYLVYAVAMGLKHNLISIVNSKLGAKNKSTDSNFYKLYKVINNESFDKAFHVPYKMAEYSEEGVSEI